MIAVSSVHQSLWQLPQQATSPNTAASEEVSNKPSPVPTTDQSNKRVKGVVDSQESHFSRHQTDQSKEASSNSHAANYSKPGHEHKLELLSEAERQQVEELRQRDREVRTHEAAHLAAAGQHATSGATYTYSRGPDGRSYAVGGSVGIDTSAEIDPQATIRKADQIRRAALAPAEPSSQDRAVAAQATSMRVQAQSDLVELQAEEKRERTQAETLGKEHSKPGLQTADAGAISGQNHTGETDEAETDNHRNHNDADNSPASCAVCGGSHGSEKHVAANQSKVDANYLGLSASADLDGSGKVSFVA